MLLILVGALLFTLPVSSRSCVRTPFLTALFTATSAVCVTGLTLVDPGAYFSVFGQAVLLALIQIGGLGFMTILCFVFILSKRRIGLRNRMLIAQNMGVESLEGVVGLAKRVICITGVIEGAGAAALSVCFIPKFGAARGVWFGIFHSVSAFCNAGFDILGDGQSMLSFRHDPLALITLSLLIIIGGLGFIVWAEVIKKHSWVKISMYSRVVILATAVLLVFGTTVFFLFEYGNPLTIGNDSMGQKILSSFFQSVTSRTAGFDAISQNNLTERSKFSGIAFMMIGGASGSTAGGVKVGAVALVMISVISVLRAKKDIVIFGRRISHSTVIHAMTLTIIWLLLVAVGTAAVSAAEKCSVLDAMYETASAYSTVGLSVGITETASVFTKILLILYMFFGRVGIMTVSVVFMVRAAGTREIRYPDGDFMVG